MSKRFAAGVMALLALASLSVRGEAAKADAPPPIEAYGRLPHIDQIVLSPSGKRIAYVVGTEQGRYVVAAEGAKLLLKQEILEAPAKGARAKTDGKLRSLQWADDDHLVVAVTKTDDVGFIDPDNSKRELMQVGVTNVVTHKAFWVFSGKDAVFGTVFGIDGFAHRNGHAYGYFEGQPIEEHQGPVNRLDLFEVDLDSGQIMQGLRGTSLDREWLVGVDGALLAYSEYDGRGEGWRLYGAKHNDLLARGKNSYDSASLDGQGRTVGTLVYDMPDEDGRTRYYETTLTKGAPQTLLFEDKAVNGLMFDRRTGLLDGLELEGDYPDITFFDPQRQARWVGTKKAFPGLNVSLESADDGFDHLVVKTEGDGDAGAYWIVDIAPGRANPLGSLYPDVPPKAVGSTRVVDYKAADGLQLHGILTLPAGRALKALPVIVLPHGGPHARDYLGFDWWAQALASRGYAVFQPNFRGSSGYGYDFAQAGFGEWGRKMQTDISDGLKYLVDQGIVDPKRACIMGGSYGGYAALAGVTLQHGLYRCAVSVAGVSDLRAMLGDEAVKHHEAEEGEGPDVRYWKDMMGAKRVGEARLREVSPAEQADHADAPILLIHGKDDTIVPIEQSRIMQRALERAGKPVEFVELDSEDHHLSREPTRIAMLKAAIAFVEKYDPPQ